ncbi:LysM peptidoglycan-binding domain-containing protein [Novilysobacter avium]|uniref:LysM peptidoglycan-binding domain-containing protein n=1 Tax=Novilysobacter avium TaxID=2781023 RepID=A0A7S6UKS1_9GAMM|nr:LysM peptidoglycan-binding domain-containing protein [Lysobacter avium]QOW22133.1 LysM peptidoglycan-binding domain-containing protein [Lysobacter avium]
MSIPRIDGVRERFAPPPPPPPRQHVVKHGDSIATIAKAEGISAQKLLAANPQVLNPDVLYPGSRVNLPEAAPAKQAAAGGSLEAKPETTARTGDTANGTTSTSKTGVKVDESGATVSGSKTDKTTTTNSSGTASTTGTSANGSIGFDSEKGTVSVSGGGGFSQGLKNAKGYGVSFGIDAQTTVTSGKKTDNGVTTYRSSADLSVTLNAGVDSKQAGLEVGRTEGIKGSFEVSMPEQIAAKTDLKTVNPFDPDSMPTGTVIKLDGSQYSGTEFKAAFRHIATESKITNFEGASLLVEKIGTDQVRVTGGPTEAIEAYNGVGVDFSVASAMIGRNDKLDAATLKTAEFNLSSADGRAAFNDYVATGTMPTANGNGVSEVATIQKLDYSSQSQLKLELGPLKASFNSAGNTGNSVLTTRADGSASATWDLRYGDNVPLSLTQSFRADGSEIIADRRYTFTYTADDSVATFLNVAQGGGIEHADSGPVNDGDTVSVSYTEAEMAQLLGHAEKALEASDGMDFKLNALIKDYDGNTIKTWDFAIALARNLGGDDYQSAYRLFNISDAADGSIGDRKGVALPGTLTVTQRAG